MKTLTWVILLNAAIMFSWTVGFATGKVYEHARWVKLGLGMNWVFPSEKKGAGCIRCFRAKSWFSK